MQSEPQPDDDKGGIETYVRESLVSVSVHQSSPVGELVFQGSNPKSVVSKISKEKLLFSALQT